jgi:RyR domain
VEIDTATLERLAEATHRSYLAAQIRGGAALGASPGLVAWDRLDDEYREANRAQVRDIVAKLARIGCVVKPGPDTGFAFSADEVEYLARHEHRRWAEQRRTTGWARGAVRDDAGKRHPDLVAWSQLSEEVREKDRDVVRNLPTMLATVGLHIARRESGPR